MRLPQRKDSTSHEGDTGIYINRIYHKMHQRGISYLIFI